MTARELALKALYSIEQSGSYTNKALSDALNRDDLSTADKGFVTELIYGVVSNKIAVDYIISRFSKIKLKKMTPWVLNILRMGIYQIYYMDKIPQSAACNEAVKLAKKYSHGAGSGFVNGVLRSAARSKAEFTFPKTDNKIADLSLEYSYPEWMTQKIAEEYGFDRTGQLFAECRKPHPVAIRVNTLKASTQEVKKQLENEGLECTIYEELEGCLLVSGKLNVNRSQAYKAGLYSLQNISSQKAVNILEAKSGDIVVDMCAAPGGKSCGIAERMENRGKVYSFDIFEHKIELIKKSAKRLGIEIIDARANDSTKLCTELIQKADRVLADVPCSGLGVIHKKPDIKWSRTEADIAELCSIQKAILSNAAEYVKPGGVLVYSTCTILPEENRLVTEDFLSNNKGFEKVYEEQILTSELGESGFYICKMVRK